MRILFDRESVCQADDAHDHRYLLDVPDSALVSELLHLLPKKVDLAANRNTVQIITNTSAPKRQSFRNRPWPCPKAGRCRPADLPA